LISTEKKKTYILQCHWEKISFVTVLHEKNSNKLWVLCIYTHSKNKVISSRFCTNQFWTKRQRSKDSSTSKQNKKTQNQDIFVKNKETRNIKKILECDPINCSSVSLNFGMINLSAHLLSKKKVFSKHWMNLLAFGKSALTGWFKLRFFLKQLSKMCFDIVRCLYGVRNWSVPNKNKKKKKSQKYKFCFHVI
jgi:hypothetical protein